MTSLEAIETTISFCSRHNYTHIVTLKQSTSVPHKNLIFKINVPPWSWTVHVNFWWRYALKYLSTYFPVSEYYLTTSHALLFYVLPLKEISYIHIHISWKNKRAENIAELGWVVSFDVDLFALQALISHSFICLQAFNFKYIIKRRSKLDIVIDKRIALILLCLCVYDVQFIAWALPKRV